MQLGFPLFVDAVPFLPFPLRRIFIVMRICMVDNAPTDSHMTSMDLCREVVGVMDWDKYLNFRDFLFIYIYMCLI